MAKTTTLHSPLILRSLRLISVFAKADDERDYYLDREEGFLVLTDLDSPQLELDALAAELMAHSERYRPVPKLTNYETRKFMEGFTNEKVYDIDTKEKLLELIGGTDAREQFLEFLHENHVELDKWLTFLQERFRIRVIEWLRGEEIQFVFEEDLDLPLPIVEKLKSSQRQAKVARDLSQARKTLQTKAATYYSAEALNPRPKRGRPPKNVQKVEIEQLFSDDLYTNVPAPVRPFLYIPDMEAVTLATFSSRHDTEEAFIASLRDSQRAQTADSDELSQKLATLRSLSRQVLGRASAKRPNTSPQTKSEPELEPEPMTENTTPQKKATPKKAPPKRAAVKKAPAKKAAPKTPAAKKAPAKKAAPKRAAPKKKAPAKEPEAPKKGSKVRRLLTRVRKKKD